MATLSFTIADAPPPRLDKALARDVPEEANLSRTGLARLIEAGAVRVDGTEVRELKAKVRAGARVEIAVPEPETSNILPEAIPLDVVHEDADLIVVNKPAGMVVHPAPGTPKGTLVNALLHHCGDTLSGIGGVQRPGIVHRIDKDTSGLLVVAKTEAAHHGLAAQFEAHSAERRYLAVCYGVPDPGDPRLRGTRGVGFDGTELRISTGLARHKTDRQRQAVTFQGGRHAVTRVVTLKGYGLAAQVRCRLETGRTHQIRVHMAHAGHGLIGDPVYGRRRALPGGVQEAVAEAIHRFPRQALHAETLGFLHPSSGQRLSFTAPVPADLTSLISALETL